MSFWKITKKDSKLKVMSYFISTLGIIVGALYDITHITYNIFEFFFILGQIFGAILVWFITFYILRLLSLGYIALDKKYAISKWENSKTFTFVMYSFLVIYIAVIAWVILVITPSIFIALFLEVYTKNSISTLILIFLILSLVGIFYVAFAFKVMTLEVLKVFKKQKSLIYYVLNKANGYILLAMCLMIISFSIGMATLNTFKYTVPFDTKIGQMNISCGDNTATEIIQNVPLACNINYYGEKNNTPTSMDFIFITNNGTESTLSYYSFLQNNKGRIGVMPSSNINMLHRIESSAPDGKHVVYLYYAVYDIKEIKSVIQSRFTSLFAIIAFSFFSIFGGVYYIKNILENKKEPKKIRRRRKTKRKK